MVNRVSLDVNGLKISQPGVNVLSATEAQLQFNSAYSGISMLARGSFTIGDGTTRTVNYGKTFPFVPAVFVVVGETGTINFPGETQLFGQRYWQHIGSGASQTSNGIRWYLNPFNNRFEFFNDDNDVNIVRWAIWDYSL